VADIWDTDGPPTANSPDLVAQPQRFTIEPPGKGLRVRYSVMGPNLDSSRIHATETLDVDFILAGQVELLLEEGRSVMLGAGDFVVLPGVKHGWRVGPDGVTILFIMQKMA
jgi:quercetin dioxygenase-like cupin family protein